MMQRAKVDNNEAIRGIIKIQSRQQCMFTYNLPATGFPCQTLTRTKENMIMKKISLKYISICLSICLLTTALLPWLPSAAHANGPSYSMRQFYKLPEAEKSGSDRILLYNREDLVCLDRYLEEGRNFTNEAFDLANNIYLSDYRFEYKKNSNTTWIYDRNTRKCLAHYDETTQQFYEGTGDTVCEAPMKGDGWNPIGSVRHPFTQTLNGNGHIIYGLWNICDATQGISTTGSPAADGAGLFAAVTGTISNLRMEGTFLSVSNSRLEDGVDGDGYDSIGALAARIPKISSDSSGNITTTIRSCYVQSTHFSCSNVPNSGVLIGQSLSPTAFDSIAVADTGAYIDCSSSSADSFTAGLRFGMVLGYSNTLYKSTFTNCASSGLATDASGMAVIGGICGTCQQDRFEHCVNQTTVRTAGVAGGIAGYIEHVVGAHECYFRYCDNLGDISGVCAGGINGFGGSYLPARYERGGRTGTNINYCRNRGAITSAYIGGGLTGVCDAFVITNSENYGTVSSTTLAKISSYPASHYETLMLAAERSVGGLIGACIPIGRKTASYYDPICTIFNCANHTSATLTPDNADAGGLIGLIATKYSTVQDLWLTLNVQNCYQASSINALASTNSSGFTPVSGSLIGDCTVTTATLEYCYAVQSDPESADVNSTCFGTQSGKLTLNAVENISGKQLLGTETEKNIGSDLLTQTTALLYCLNGYINSGFRYDQTQWISKQSESEEPMLIIDDYTLPTEPPIVSFAPEKTTSPVPSATGTPAGSVAPSPSGAPISSSSPAATDTPTTSSSPATTGTPTVTFSPAPSTTGLPTDSSSPVPSPGKQTNTPASPSGSSVPDFVQTGTPSDQMSLSAAPHRSGGIRITWKLSSVWNGFVLYRSPKASGIYQPVATISSFRKAFTDKKVTAGKTYHYKAIPYILKNGQTIYGNTTVIRKATARLMAPTFRVSRHRTASGRRFLQIRLHKYQGKYADIYIRNNHGKYLRLRLKNNNIRQQKQTFRLQYSFRKATLSIRIRTYKQKKRTKGSFYSRAKVVRIRE